MSEGLSNSQFYMWRAVVAMAHADGVVTPHEVNFLQQSMKDLTLSAAQTEVLSQDIAVPQDIHAMFVEITDKRDQLNFFKLARILSWSDGDFDQQEEKIIQKLEKLFKEDNQNLALFENSREEVKEIVMDGLSSSDKDDEPSDFFARLKNFLSA